MLPHLPSPCNISFLAFHLWFSALCDIKVRLSFAVSKRTSKLLRPSLSKTNCFHIFAKNLLIIWYHLLTHFRYVSSIWFHFPPVYPLVKALDWDPLADLVSRWRGRYLEPSATRFWKAGNMGWQHGTIRTEEANPCEHLWFRDKGTIRGNAVDQRSTAIIVVEIRSSPYHKIVWQA